MLSPVQGVLPIVYSSCNQSGLRVPPWVREDILRNRLNLEPARIFSLTKIRPRIEVLTCLKQAQSSY
jgi:hypothetical protein